MGLSGEERKAKQWAATEREAARRAAVERMRRGRCAAVWSSNPDLHGVVALVERDADRLASLNRPKRLQTAGQRPCRRRLVLCSTRRILRLCAAASKRVRSH